MALFCNHQMKGVNSNMAAPRKQNHKYYYYHFNYFKQLLLLLLFQNSTEYSITFSDIQQQSHKRDSTDKSEQSDK